MTITEKKEQLNDNIIRILTKKKEARTDCWSRWICFTKWNKI